MKLVDLKRTEADKKAEAAKWGGDATSVAHMEDYPYGLSLRLDDAAMKKLGLDGTSFNAEDRVMVLAAAMVQSEESNSVGGKVQRTMTLQIQKLCIEPGDGSSSEDVVARMYGGRDAD